MGGGDSKVDNAGDDSAERTLVDEFSDRVLFPFVEYLCPPELRVMRWWRGLVFVAASDLRERMRRSRSLRRHLPLVSEDSLPRLEEATFEASLQRFRDWCREARASGEIPSGGDSARTTTSRGELAEVERSLFRTSLWLSTRAAEQEDVDLADEVSALASWLHQEARWNDMLDALLTGQTRGTRTDPSTYIAEACAELSIGTDPLRVASQLCDEILGLQRDRATLLKRVRNRESTRRQLR